MIKLLSFIVLTLFVATVWAVESGEIIQFSRPLSPESVFECNIKASQYSKALLHYGDSDSGTADIRDLEIELSGQMTIVRVNSSGNAAEIFFDIKAIRGSGLSPSSCAGLSGKRIRAVLDLTPPLITIEGSSEIELTHEEKRLLYLIFRPASKETLDDLIGTEKLLKIGSTWKPSFKIIEKLCAARRITATAKNFEGQVTLGDIANIHDIPCWKINQEIQASAIKDFDFRFHSEIYLPVNPEDGSAIKISRSGYDRYKRALPASQPLSAGRILETENKEDFQAEIVPLSLEKSKSYKTIRQH